MYTCGVYRVVEWGLVVGRGEVTRRPDPVVIRGGAGRGAGTGSDL